MVKKKVLVVDDQIAFREAVAFEFEMLGYDQEMAENGQDALDKFNENKFDLIISDIRMPIWDGRKFLNELRKITFQKPPFIFMTGFTDIKIYNAFDEGADAFIGKPINPDSLKQMVEYLESPLDVKWGLIPRKPSQRKLSIQIDKKDHFQCGRAGFFVAADLVGDLKNYAVGDSIEFEIEPVTNDLPILKGHGSISWVRDDQLCNLIPGLGIMIEYLESACLHGYIEHINSSSVVAVIPRGGFDPLQI